MGTGNPFLAFEGMLARLVELDAIEDAARREHDALMDGCRHQEYALRVTVASNGNRMYFSECPDCGRRSEFIAHKKLPRKLMEDARGAQGGRADVLRGRMLKVRQLSREIRWTPGFRELYMASPAWRAKRVPVLERSGGVCEHCRSAPAEVVHHLTYRRLGNEPLDHLAALCSACHRACHPEHQEELIDDREPVGG